MHYQEQVKNKRNSSQIEKDKLALVDLLVNKLEASGLSKDTVNDDKLLIALTSIADKIDAIEPTDNTEIIDALNILANKETTINYTAPDVIVPELKIPDIHIPEITIPKIIIPKINIPKIIIPEISLPKIPDIYIPEITIPKITVPNIDTTGIETVLREMQHHTPEGIDLDDYMAQDLKKIGGNQYVGFLNPDGAWYIIENDIKGESLRYLFGTKDYYKHFKKANEYVYKLLNEAVNAI
jgi:hypothetical protein